MDKEQIAAILKIMDSCPQCVTKKEKKNITKDTEKKKN